MRRTWNLTATGIALLSAALTLAPALAQVDDHRKLVYPQLQRFDIPRPTVTKLANGMTVYLMQDRELPLIDVSARIRSGSNHDPADAAGLGDIFGQVLREGGTTTMSGDEIDLFLEARAASIETGMSGDFGSASMGCLKEDFDEVFRLFADVLRNPAFAADKLELAKVQTNSGIARRNDNIGGIAAREFSRLIYGPDSPLSRLTEYAGVAGVDADDLRRWHRRDYHPNRIMLGIVGDFEPDAMLKKVKATFGDWPRGPETKVAPVPFASVKPGVYFVEKEDTTQAFVRIGHLGIRFEDPDYFAVQVMNEVLGGGFTSRLFSNVRTAKGLAYNVFGGVGASFLRPGVFQTGLSTKSGTTAQSIDALREEINGIIQRPATDEELERAKESILNSFVFNYTSRRQILDQQMTYAYYGLPADFLDTYRRNIEKVTRDDVARVARKTIHPDRLVTLVVGKAADFDRPLSEFGTVATLDITIPPPPDTRKQIERTADSLSAGSTVFARAARLLRGKAADDLQSMQARFKVSLQMGGQTMALGQQLTVQYPDKLRQVTTSPMGEQVVLLNGDRGVVTAGGQTQPLPSERISEGLQALGRDLLFLSSSPDVEAVGGGSDSVDGSACAIVSVSLLDAESQLCIDAEGRVLRQSYHDKHPLQGTPGVIQVVFGDWQELAGRMLPRKRMLSFEGQPFAEVTLEELLINPQLDPAQFEVQ